ncbi:MAG: ABC transporter permease [Candidatus Dormibacteraeota bacterium]|nr:ABC transporter permease [Candidatus Dormibacteraeota bacterium]
MSLGINSATPAVQSPGERTPSPGVVRVLGKIVRSYAFNRIWRALLTIYVVITLTFFLVREMPGSPIAVYIQNLMGQYGMSYPDALARAQALFQFNPNEPLIQQYWTYLQNLAHGNMGQSFLSPGTSVTSIIASYLPWTLFSVGLGLLTSFVLGISLGMIMAYKRESVLDHGLTVTGSFFHSVPNYILGMLIVVLLGIQLGLFSVADMRGSYSAGIQPGISPAFIGDALYHAALPIVTYVLTTIGGWMLIMKSSTIATLEEDYVTVARARGLRDGRIVTAYVGRNAILPLFAQLAISIGFVVGGSLLVEWLFQYQGIGLALYNAIYMRDYTVMQGIFLVLTVSIVTANLLADLLYGRLDPRVRITRQQ